jgi:hypothetical protein
MIAPILQWSELDFTVPRKISLLQRVKGGKKENITLLNKVSGGLHEGEMLASEYKVPLNSLLLK